MARTSTQHRTSKSWRRLVVLGACVAAGLCSKTVALPHTLQDVKGGKSAPTCGWGTVAPCGPWSPSALTLRGGQPPAEHVPDDTESATEGLRTQKHDAAGGEDALEEAERIMEMAKTRLEAKADKRKSDMDVHEQERRSLLADAYSRASQGQEEESEDMEEVTEALEELARCMAEFKELTKSQKEKIKRGDEILDEVMDTVAENIPAMAQARKAVDEVVQVLRATNRSQIRSQFVKIVSVIFVIYLSMKL